MRSIIFLACTVLGSCLGCSNPADKLFNNPEMQKAMVQMVRDSQKQWEYGAEIHNPELEISQKTGIVVRIIGLHGNVGISGVAPPTPPTTPNPP